MIPSPPPLPPPSCPLAGQTCYPCHPTHRFKSADIRVVVSLLPYIPFRQIHSESARQLLLPLMMIAPAFLCPGREGAAAEHLLPMLARQAHPRAANYVRLRGKTARNLYTCQAFSPWGIARKCTHTEKLVGGTGKQGSGDRSSKIKWENREERPKQKTDRKYCNQNRARKKVNFAPSLSTQKPERSSLRRSTGSYRY